MPLFSASLHVDVSVSLLLSFSLSLSLLTNYITRPQNNYNYKFWIKV